MYMTKVIHVHTCTITVFTHVYIRFNPGECVTNKVTLPGECVTNKVTLPGECVTNKDSSHPPRGVCYQQGFQSPSQVHCDIPLLPVPNVPPPSPQVSTVINFAPQGHMPRLNPVHVNVHVYMYTMYLYMYMYMCHTWRTCSLIHRLYLCTYSYTSLHKYM